MADTHNPAFRPARNVHNPRSSSQACSYKRASYFFTATRFSLRYAPLSFRIIFNAVSSGVTLIKPWRCIIPLLSEIARMRQLTISGFEENGRRNIFSRTRLKNSRRSFRFVESVILGIMMCMSCDSRCWQQNGHCHAERPAKHMQAAECLLIPS